MLTPSPKYGVALVICPGQDAMAGHAHHMNHRGHRHSHQPENICPLAHFGAVDLASGGTHTTHVTYAAYWPVPTAPAVDQAPGLGPTAPPPLPARGPPLQA